VLDVCLDVLTRGEVLDYFTLDPTLTEDVPIVFLRTATGPDACAQPARDGLAALGHELLRLDDIDPSDDCHAGLDGTDAIFRCDRGPHPSVCVRAAQREVVATVLDAMGAPTGTYRVPVPAGHCVKLHAGWSEWLRRDERDVFRIFAAAQHDQRDAGARAAEDPRCADAGSPGPVVDVRVVVQSTSHGSVASLSIPTLAVRERILPPAGSPPTACVARAFPRSRAILVQCRDADQSHDSAIVEVQGDHLGTHALPCHAQVRLSAGVER
jgi:hypothetical protein